MVDDTQISQYANKKLGIMQPYFLPYIGYFQLIAAVDLFVVYDNIKYTKKGWINRNRLLQNDRDVTFSLPIKKGSDHANVVDRELAGDFNPEKLLNVFTGAYRRAPYFAPTMALLERILNNVDRNLFGFIYYSLLEICGYLGIETEIQVSSRVLINHDLKAEEKVIALCKATNADIYINAIGGQELYSGSNFQAAGVELKFLKSTPVVYTQFNAPFVPWLSIIDVMMFNSREQIGSELLGSYQLINTSNNHHTE